VGFISQEDVMPETAQSIVKVGDAQFEVAERFTSAVKYIRETIFDTGTQEVPIEGAKKGETKTSLTEPRFLTDATTGSRIYLGPDQARSAIVSEVK
jgi:hypothetical protein